MEVPNTKAGLTEPYRGDIADLHPGPELPTSVAFLTFNEKFSTSGLGRTQSSDCFVWLFPLELPLTGTNPTLGEPIHPGIYVSA